MNNINIVNVMFIPPKLPCALKKKKKKKNYKLDTVGIEIPRVSTDNKKSEISLYMRKRERERTWSTILVA